MRLDGSTEQVTHSGGVFSSKNGAVAEVGVESVLLNLEGAARSFGCCFEAVDDSFEKGGNLLGLWRSDAVPVKRRRWIDSVSRNGKERGRKAHFMAECSGMTAFEETSRREKDGRSRDTSVNIRKRDDASRFEGIRLRRTVWCKASVGDDSMNSVEYQNQRA